MLSAVELINEIKMHAEKNQKSRTAKAWNLTEKYYQDCNAKNPELVNAIYKYACQHTRFLGTKLFSSFLQVPEITKMKVEDESYTKDVRGFWIKLELDTEEQKLTCPLTK
ncbi:MAG: hypothetical protein H0W64_04890 [Gammaproteobacteria bacterium]|nr:hypothetical protein [Gammaproteobacteria bacterium]